MAHHQCSHFQIYGIIKTLLVISCLVASTWGIPPLQIQDESWVPVKDYMSSNRLVHKDGHVHRPILNVEKEVTENMYKLPENVRPTHYKIKIMPVFQDLPGTTYNKFTAPGEVTITIECLENTNVITLHQKNLNISFENVKVREQSTGADIMVANHTMEETVEFYRIHLVSGSELLAGKTYEIYIPYIAPISLTELSGIYLSNYVDPESQETRYLTTTQFQPTDARKAWPCFDEPYLKAVFEITVGRSKQFHSLSNMEINSTTQNAELSDWVWDQFNPTIPLSTYLIAVIVSDFKNVTADSSLYNKPIKIFAAPHLIDAQGGNYAAETAAKIVNYFQSSFGVEYPLPKLYSVAIPQFSAGAMENAGLNTYRTEYVIHIPGENTEAERKKITQVLSHEISHQWFGNLVTCKTWQFTYLNEGFARFLQYRGMAHAANEFNMDIAIVSDATQLGMVYDHGVATHPVKNDAQSPDEINEIFDRISYDKGASLLRMAEGFLSRQKFDDSIRYHLNSKLNNSADQTDLFNAFQSIAGDRLPDGVTFAQIMDTWTLQPAYPLVRVSKASNNNKIYLSQERYKLNTGASELTVQAEGNWFIPVKIVTAQNPNFTETTPTLWIPNNTSLLSYEQNTIDTSKWVIVNPDLVGYYRVLYDTPLRKLIVAQLLQNHTVISRGTRSQLVEDYFNFANAQYVQIESALEFTQYLEKETELVVWTAVLPNIRNIMTRLTAEDDALGVFRDYFLPKFERVLEALGWEQMANEKGANVIIRSQLLDYACALNHTTCTEYAQRLFENWSQTPENRTIVPADIRPVVFCSAIAQGDQTTWTQAYTLYRAEKFDATKAQLYKALACAQDIGVLTRFLELAFDGTSGFSIVTALQNVAGNSFGRELVYRYIVEKYGTKGPLGPSQFTAVVSTLSTYWNDQLYIDQIHEFISKNGDTLGAIDLGSLNSSISRIQANILWWKEDGQRILNWMAAAVSNKIFWIIVTLTGITADNIQSKSYRSQSPCQKHCACKKFHNISANSSAQGEMDNGKHRVVPDVGTQTPQVEKTAKPTVNNSEDEEASWIIVPENKKFQENVQNCIKAHQNFKDDAVKTKKPEKK